MLAVEDEYAQKEQILQRLSLLYREEAGLLYNEILQLIEQYAPRIRKNAKLAHNQHRWDEQDVILITYGDSLIDAERKQRPLKLLADFAETYLQTAVSSLHILPFYPYSSDDGFSVIDYRQVNPELGGWDDILSLAQHSDLMFDFVLNHVSRESLWFVDFLSDMPPANQFFIEMDPETDLSLVVRPRNSPLLVPVRTHRGIKHLWATFSEDQIDLNFENPRVLLEMIDIFLKYIAYGARYVRLDAVGFLWKQVGTKCIHLEETHQVVKLMRNIINIAAPYVILITETNVPNKENISYFGEGDEAHMVYQFGLPPLLLHALNRGNTDYLCDWIEQIPDLPEGCTYLNFTASHDGIGLRSLEGVLTSNEVQDLIDCMHKFGGFVSMKANADGTDSPYEINISYFDAMKGTRRGEDQWQVERFLCSQSLMMSLRGIPAVYIHSLLGTKNDLELVEITGRTRSINRKRWVYDEICGYLAEGNSQHAKVFNEMTRRLALRRQQAAFHPDATQQLIRLGHGLLGLRRENTEQGQLIIGLFNMTAFNQSFSLQAKDGFDTNIEWLDLLTGEHLESAVYPIELSPYQCMWLTPSPKVIA